MFGVSFSEVVVIAAVALIVVGPQKLPELLRKLGQWVARLRQMTTDVRRQTGIDEILRSEGLGGGINELRSLIRGEMSTVQNLAAGAGAAQRYPSPSAGMPNTVVDPYGDALDYDRLREHPVEGVDAYGAIPEDLLAAAAPEAPVPPPVVVKAAAPEPVVPTTDVALPTEPSHVAPPPPEANKDPA